MQKSYLYLIPTQIEYRDPYCYGYSGLSITQMSLGKIDVRLHQCSLCFRLSNSIKPILHAIQLVILRIYDRILLY